MANTILETMKTMTFGVELEYSGISRAKAAEAIATAVGGVSEYEGGYYQKIAVKLADGRKWTVMTDGSVYNGCESVSPILTLADMDMLQAVVRALRGAGAKPHSSCGMHIHIGAKDMTPNEVTKLAKMWWMGEDIFIAGCGTRAERTAEWCRKLNWDFANKLVKAGAKMSWDKMVKLYYTHCGRINGYRGGVGSISSHYSDNRYSALNLHNLLQFHKLGEGKPTIEFRLFEPTTHAGEVKANVMFAMSVVAKAMSVKSVVTNERKWTNNNGWRGMFGYLGWTGDEFKAARFHFLKRATANA